MGLGGFRRRLQRSPPMKALIAGMNAAIAAAAVAGLTFLIGMLVFHSGNLVVPIVIGLVAGAAVFAVAWSQLQ